MTKRSVLFLILLYTLICKATNKDSLCGCYDTAYTWLPETYLFNARSICHKSPDEFCANTIRVFLLNYFSGSVSDSLMNEARQKKELFNQKKLSKRKYKKYIKQKLVPVIHKAHCIAYARAGCKSDPAPYWQWKYACTHKIRNKHWAWFCVKTLGGSCSGRTGRW